MFRSSAANAVAQPRNTIAAITCVNDGRILTPPVATTSRRSGVDPHALRTSTRHFSWSGFVSPTDTQRVRGPALRIHLLLRLVLILGLRASGERRSLRLGFSLPKWTKPI